MSDVAIGENWYSKYNPDDEGDDFMFWVPGDSGQSGTGTKSIDQPYQQKGI